MKKIWAQFGHEWSKKAATVVFAPINIMGYQSLDLRNITVSVRYLRGNAKRSTRVGAAAGMLVVN